MAHLNMVSSPLRLGFLVLAAAASLTAQPALPTVFVAGDSTANNTNHQGWGDPFADYFDPAKINVQNRARAGRSARTFLSEGLWDKILADVKAGDYVIIQFGHNDGSAPDQPPYRGDLPGTGDEPKTPDMTMKDGKIETIYPFGWYIRKFVHDTQAKGAHPIVMSLTVRNIWKDGHVERGSGQFGKWSQEVAEAEKVPFVDVTNIIADAYEKMGEAPVKELFPVDHTPHEPARRGPQRRLHPAGGAERNRMISSGEIPLSAKGERRFPAAPDLARLHLSETANSALPSIFLIGDSTVRNGHGDGAGGQWGWGEPLFNLLDPAKVNLVNRAVGGLSKPHFLYRPLLAENAGDD